jgi:NADPH:quinone reductase-like Zn-dependent oxidoreductase
MKAIVYSRYGHSDVLRLADVDKPVPAADEVLIRVRAASVNPIDLVFMTGSPYLIRLMTGVFGPKTGRLGADLAGQVEAVGRNVSRLKPGDEVFGSGRGAFAEYACAPERALAGKPPGLSFENAASLSVAGITALQGLRDRGRVQAGQRVLINGASGGVGTFAVQIAGTLGAQVSGVCSTRNLELVRSLGAQEAIDYTREDFTRRGRCYDLILDCIGNHSLSALRRALEPKGTYVMVGGRKGRWLTPMDRPLKAMLLSLFVSQDMGMLMARINREDLLVLSDLVQAEKVKPVIDRRTTLSEVPAALRYLAEGHARGKVIITL